jgi:outer membrane protein assembly factor BamB
MNLHYWKIAGFIYVLFGFFVNSCQSAGIKAEEEAFVPPPSATQLPAPTLTNTLEALPTEQPTIVWSIQTSGPIWGAPALSDGIVYIGSDDHALYAIEAQNSQLKWKFLTQGFIRSQPAISDGSVYISSDDGFVYAINAQTGKQVWRTDIGNQMPPDEREKLGTNAPTDYDYLQSSPVVKDGQVYVGSLDGKVYALSADKGGLQWSYQTGDKVRATPFVEDQVVYIGSWDKYFYALNARTGELIWKTPLGGQVQSTAAAADGLVFCASRKASLVGLDQNTGEIKWEYDYGNNNWVESSPRLVNGILYIGSSANKFVLGIEPETGALSTLYISNAFHWGIPTIEDDVLYIGGTAAGDLAGDVGGLYAIQLNQGKFARQFGDVWLEFDEETLEASGIWSGVASSAVISNEVIYFGGLDGKLYAVKVVNSIQ